MTSIIKISNEIVHECIDTALQNVTENNKQTNKDTGKKNSKETDRKTDRKTDKETQTDNKKIVMKESKKRSCIKAITWRILATLTTVTISYFYLNDMSVAAKIGVIDSSIKFAIHYAHERAYNRLRWGYVEKEIDC